jgi:hypothetical protein
MSRHHFLPSLLSLLLLLLGPSGCQAVVQFARVNGTITYTPAPAESANVLGGNTTARSIYSRRTREMFVDGIAAKPTANPLFTAPPVVLRLSVIRVRNPTTSSIAVSFTSTLRITSATLLTDLNYLVDVKFAPYFSVLALIPEYLDDLATSIPTVFGSVTGFFGDIGEGRDIPNPNPNNPGPTPTRRPAASPTRRPAASPTRRPAASPTRRPAASPTRRPAASPTRRPAASPTRRPSSPTRRPASPTRRPMASPTNRPPSCLPNSNVCGMNNAICCSKRCVDGMCQ